MKCFSGVDVLNALLRKVTIIRVDREGGDATEAFYNRESGPLAAARFSLVTGAKGILDKREGFYMEEGTWQSPLCPIFF